jgi:hypothetical protein
MHKNFMIRIGAGKWIGGGSDVEKTYDRLLTILIITIILLKAFGKI